MFTCKEYRKVETLEEAWQLNQKKGNLLIGGMLWTKMGSRNVQAVIDLSGLGLDKIEESDTEFRIGCMVTLRQIETDQGLNDYTDGAVRESVCHIVGVQFRNLATVGGSIFGRFGFSDVLTMFLALDSYVELYKGGIVPMAEFVSMKRDRDILVRVIVKKNGGAFAYQSVRNVKTDFPTLACAAASINGKLRISVGARPARAMLLEVPGLLELGAGTAGEPCKSGSGRRKGSAKEVYAAEVGAYAAENIPVGSNLRGSEAYRREMVKVLVKRACLEVL